MDYRKLGYTYASHTIAADNSLADSASDIVQAADVERALWQFAEGMAKRYAELDRTVVLVRTSRKGGGAMIVYDDGTEHRAHSLFKKVRAMAARLNPGTIKLGKNGAKAVPPAQAIVAFAKAKGWTKAQRAEAAKALLAMRDE